MGDYPVFRGWDIIGRASRNLKRSITNIGKSYEAKQVDGLADEVIQKLRELDSEDRAGREDLAADIASHILERLAPETDDALDDVLGPRGDRLDDVVGVR